MIKDMFNNIILIQKFVKIKNTLGSNIIQIWTGPEFNMEKYGTAKTYYIDRGPRPRSI